MLAVDIIAVATALVSLFSAAISSSCYSCICPRYDTVTIELLKAKKKILGDLIVELKRKYEGEAVLTMQESSFMSTAAAFLAEANESIEKLEGAIDEKCVCGLLHNPCAQNQARSKMKDKSLELDHLIDQAEIMKGTTVRGYRQSCGIASLGKKRKQVVDEIWRLVSEAEGPGKLICIHGTLGVGKTAIANYIHKNALNDVLFDYIIWITVEDGAGLWQVQHNIATRLKIDLPSTGDVQVVDNVRLNITKERAKKLKAALSDLNKFLIVLDSMWETLSLKQIGIPELLNGRNVIVTSRLHTVCSAMGGTKYEIKPLPTEEEAWQLFQDEMDEHFIPETCHTAIKRELLAKLDGLPLAISMFAQRLKKINHTDLCCKWRKELDYLAKQQVYPKGTNLELFNRFTDSCKNLEEKTRQCFLYCAIFPKNHLIDSKEVIEYWMWEDLLSVNNADRTLGKEREVGEAILEELINAHLLEGTSTGTSDAEIFVKMLSLFRDMAIDTIDKEENPVGSRACLPPSIQRNQLKFLDLKRNLNCNQLSTLLLQDNLLDLGVEDYFFDSTPNLKVLDMSRTKISTLPKSLSKLVKLRALLLRNCSNLKAVPNLSDLQQVIVLDLSGTPLQDCPLGIPKMTKLRRLNLSQTKIATFPPDTIAKLIELEELLIITDNNCVWGSKGDKKWKGACIEDLEKVQKLALIQLHFRNTKAFDKYVNTMNDYTQLPSKFCFHVGEVKAGETVEGNSLAISGLSIGSGTPAENRTLESSWSMRNDIILQKLRYLNVLDVSNFSGLSSLLSAKVLASLTQLRELRVRSCKKMVDVVVLHPADQMGKIDLPELTRMELFDLPRLKSVCCIQLDCPKLVSIRVQRCDSLKLPLIGSSGKKIKIIGEGSWLQNLKTQSIPNFTLAEESAPEVLLNSASSTATDREKLQGGGDGLVGATMDWVWSLMDGQGNNKPSESNNAQQTEIKLPVTPTDQAEELVPPELVTASTAADKKKVQGDGDVQKGWFRRPWL